jgi:magnesium transporter
LPDGSRTVELSARRWIHVAAPDGDDRRRLEELGLPGGFVDHALDPDELARIVRGGDDGQLLVTIRLPPGEGGSRSATTLGVAVLPDRVITVSRDPAPALVVEVAGRDVIRDARPLRQVVELLLAIAQAYVGRVAAIDDRVEQLERDLARSLQNREVLALLDEQKALVHLERALASNRIMLDRLLGEPRCAPEGDEVTLLQDAVVEFEQAMEMTRISTEILASMMDAFASIINNNLNQVFRVLAALTVIVAVPGVLAALWGMNVPVPGAGRTWAFAVLVVSVLAAAGGIALLFRSRRWL